MKSGELARLAGVTVRTLRHYRDIGLLPEPARTDNGYCDYTGDDYFRLLRIKNLSSLGFSLAEIKTFLDHPETAPDSNLDALDARLAENIEKLNAQRRTIALLKASQASVDMPPLFADFLALLSHQNLPDDILQMEINSFLSVADNLNEDALQEIVAFYQSLTQKNLLSQYIRLFCALYSADDSMDGATKEALAEDLSALLTAILGPIRISSDRGLFENDADLLGLPPKNATILQEIYDRTLEILAQQPLD